MVWKRRKPFVTVLASEIFACSFQMPDFSPSSPFSMGAQEIFWLPERCFLQVCLPLCWWYLLCHIQASRMFMPRSLISFSCHSCSQSTNMSPVFKHLLQKMLQAPRQPSLLDSPLFLQWKPNFVTCFVFVHIYLLLLAFKFQIIISVNHTAFAYIDMHFLVRQVLFSIVLVPAWMFLFDCCMLGFVFFLSP